MENRVKFCPIMPIIIGLLWCAIGVAFCCCEGHAKFGIWPALLTHIAFLVFFICSILFSYKAFALNVKIMAEEKLKKDEFERKKDWEQTQYDLNKPEREFRRDIETKKLDLELQEKRQKLELERNEREQKLKNDGEKFDFGLNKEREDIDEIKKLKGEKWTLEEELKKFKDTTVADREKSAQAFHLLALILSDQNIFADNKTVEEKLKQIDNDYNLLKKTLTDIKL